MPRFAYSLATIAAGGAHGSSGCRRDGDVSTCKHDAQLTQVVREVADFLHADYSRSDLSQETIHAAVNRAFHELAGSVRAEALPEMAGRLAAARLTASGLTVSDERYRSGGPLLAPSSCSPPDHHVRSTVLRELTSVRDLDLRSIDVDVVDGAVTLRGHLPSPTVHDAAIAAVLNCREVAGIADGTDTRQRHDTPSDADILAAARLAIAAAANTAAPSIDVSVHGGIVTLRGPIAWNFQRDAAAAAIDRLPGVVTVVNELVITPFLPDVSPEQVRRRVAAALARRGLGRPSSLDVTVDRDVVTLTGVLSSQVTIREALEAAASTSGVAGVVDRLTFDDHANQ